MRKCPDCDNGRLDMVTDGNGKQVLVCSNGDCRTHHPGVSCPKCKSNRWKGESLYMGSIDCVCQSCGHSWTDS